MTTGTMEIARDGTVVNETHTQTPEPQGAEAGLAVSGERLSENPQDRIAGFEEYEARCEAFKTSFKA